MKKIFYLGCIGLILFEIANVYFIMPMPGSQEMNTLGLAYFLYKWRWIFRSIFTIFLLSGLLKTHWKQTWTIAIPLLILSAVIYIVNFKMAADAMFTQPKNITLSDINNNKVESDRLVIGVEDNGIAKAYPIQYLGYHHFVYDTINGKDILVTYCTVCRSGRVFDPTVNGKMEKFRLVGMDHYNAMLEDASTKSWWQQATGEAITGKLKGTKLKEIFSTQTSLKQWQLLYPNTTIMQRDLASLKKYDTTFNYETGKRKSRLTGTDSLSWLNKSWVVGVKINGERKAFDWNELKQKRILESNLGNVKAFVVLANDDKSFFAFVNDSETSPVLIGDTILLNKKKFKLNGSGIDTVYTMTPLYAYQEFWHSWQYFSKEKINK